MRLLEFVDFISQLLLSLDLAGFKASQVFTLTLSCRLRAINDPLKCLTWNMLSSPFPLPLEEPPGLELSPLFGFLDGLSG